MEAGQAVEENQEPKPEPRKRSFDELVSILAASNDAAMAPIDWDQFELEGKVDAIQFVLMGFEGKKYTFDLEAKKNALAADAIDNNIKTLKRRCAESMVTADIQRIEGIKYYISRTSRQTMKMLRAATADDFIKMGKRFVASKTVYSFIPDACKESFTAGTLEAGIVEKNTSNSVRFWPNLAKKPPKKTKTKGAKK